MIVTLILADRLVQVIRINRDLHHVHLVPIEIENEKPHARAVRMREDQRLLVPVAAGLANDPLPSLAKFLFGNPIQFLAVSRFVEVLELGNVNTGNAAVRERLQPGWQFPCTECALRVRCSGARWSSLRRQIRRPPRLLHERSTAPQ